LITVSYVGLDLAQPQESTALAAPARQVVSRETTSAVRHLQRWPPDTHYPPMAAEITRLLGSRELRGCRMVVDQTAVGRAVASMFRPAGAGGAHHRRSCGHAG
jgi:hypothetical protein